MHWIQSMERKIHSLPFLWVEEIATSESESSFAFPRRLGSPRSDASASFPEMELGEVRRCSSEARGSFLDRD